MPLKKLTFLKGVCLLCLLVIFNSSFGQKPSPTPLTYPTASTRSQISLNGLWLFKSNNANETVEIPVPSTYTNVWDGKWGRPYWDAFAFPRKWKDGAVYEKTINVSEDWKNKLVRLKVNGCLQNYSVIFDDKVFDTIHDGYVCRYFTLGTNLDKGKHRLAIRVENEGTRLNGGESAKTRGIWDDIELEILPLVHVNANTVINTSVTQQSISAQFSVFNTFSTTKTITAKCFITDAEGKVATTFGGKTYTLPANGNQSIRMEGSWANPRLWFPHDPYLYHLNIVLVDEEGKLLDKFSERFGFKEYSWKNAKLYLNGRELWLRGHGEHYLGDIQGSKEYFRTWLTELKKLGVNFMRLHIYPRHKALYEVADEVGFFLEAEPAFHFKVPTDTLFAMRHLGDMMQSLINHPSIFSWSVSNELRWSGGGEKKWLIDKARSIDTTRPVFASDFSEFSVLGDAIGHHYNTETVFQEWEKFGPDKPMIWDECGEVWQPNRPLGNGTAGYEVIAQDYATGIYRDGKNEIKAAFDLVREGQTFHGYPHRINAISPWDLGCVFFRWQPYNQFKGIVPQYSNLGLPGVKPRQVLPCSTPLNIWDSSLPVYEPNPGYYLFDEDIKWVRFPYDSKNFSFFGGTLDTIKSPLVLYEDMRLVDEVHCKIETPDGKVLTENIQKLSIHPGDMLRKVDWYFKFPSVLTATPVRIVREFWYQGKSGYKDIREGQVFPKLSLQNVDLKGNKVGVIDEKGALKKLLLRAGIPFKDLLGHSQGQIEKDSIKILLISSNKYAEMIFPLVSKGINIVSFKEGQNLKKGSARLLTNGAPYKILNGIDQQGLTFWKGGNEHGGFMNEEGQFSNTRVLIAGDKDGKTNALTESYIGKGCYWLTSLRIIESIDQEPTAGWLLHNLINVAANYSPSIKAKRTAVYGDTGFVFWLRKLQPHSEVLTGINAATLKKTEVLFLDARTHQLSKEEVDALKTFVSQGGRVMLYQIKDNTLESYKSLIHDSLSLTQPFLNEKSGCVKAATSWTLRSTPKTGVEYYDSIVIPQPFEPNYHPFLSGLSNILLNWNGKPMFENGIKIKGISPVTVNDSFRILVSNWRNDWSVPPFGGEYINEGKDMRQALWYLNRDPVVAVSQQGKGEYMFCQLDLTKGGEKGEEFLQHLLTYWQCGGKETYFLADKEVFDFRVTSDQKKRLEKVEKYLCTLKTPDSLPKVLFDMGGSIGGKQRKILLLADGRVLQLAPDIIKKLVGFSATSYSGVTINNPSNFLNNIESALGGSRWDVVYLSVGYEGISDLTEKGLDKFDKDMQKIVETIKNTGAKILWGTQPPLPTSAQGSSNSTTELLNKRARKIMEANGVLVNDTYGFVMEKTPEYLKQDKSELTLINSDFFKTFTPKLVSSIVEALKFFGN